MEIRINPQFNATYDQKRERKPYVPLADFAKQFQKPQEDVIVARGGVDIYA